jgi:uncharacterized protein YwqG
LPGKAQESQHGNVRKALNKIKIRINKRITMTEEQKIMMQNLMDLNDDLFKKLNEQVIQFNETKNDFLDNLYHNIEFGEKVGAICFNIREVNKEMLNIIHTQ